MAELGAPIIGGWGLTEAPIHHDGARSTTPT